LNILHDVLLFNQSVDIKTIIKIICLANCKFT